METARDAAHPIPGNGQPGAPAAGVTATAEAMAAFSAPLASLEVPQRASDVLDLFAAVVGQQASATAVSWRGLATSYGQLDRRSSQVANALVDNGARAGSFVAILLADPLERIVAILGCLKAGCVFAPMDIAAPPLRLRQMLDTVAADWAIVDRGTLASLAEAAPRTGKLLLLDSGEVDLGQRFAVHEAPIRVADHGEGHVRVAMQPDDPCYLYFTSGSTGRPKAILGRIRGLAHFIQWEIDSFGLGPGSRVSQLTGPTFDVYLRDVFAALCSGGTACPPPEGTTLDPVRLGQWIETEGITLMHCVPSLFRLLLHQDLSPRRFPQLRHVLLAGESLAPADANRWIACFGSRARLVNLYGPTETTLAKFFHPLPATPVGEDFVPIGRPIPGAQAILLDERLTPCAPGELGEIFIRTPYRSLGYFNADQDAQPAFIVNPFTGAEDDLVYRTGDLARWLPDGSLRFCGRKDFQVKIRGVRVEVAEIEARLLQCPRVREAAVLGCADAQGEMRLVAYYVPAPVESGQAPVSVAELRAFLAQWLPEAMMPSVFVALDRFPISANGKLDRRALPAPGGARPELAVAYEPAANLAEQRLCTAFAGVLALDRVGRHDNFFELGGNSLLAAHLLATLQQQTGGVFPATVIFGHPTPASLALALEEGAGSRFQTQRLALAHRPSDSPRPEAPAGREAIAIIGMAGRFPGAADVEQFWDNLCAGRESITVFGADELDPSIPEADRLDPGYVPARGVLDGVEDFDAAFFGVNPREAELMDPQHRIFLELCWECMERAGEVPDAATVPVGVFAGTYHSTYLRRHVAAHPDKVAQVGQYQVTLANEKDYLATRVANKLNLTGPAISLYTACSTSLVAICQALDSLRAGRCDMALAGGISITCPPRSGYLHQEGAMFSPDGHTRAFDAQAQGTVFSDGAGVVLLKRLSDALRDGNPVHAVILGAAVNNDGGDKASFTAPNGDAQAAVIAMAQDDARVSPRSISYVEAHGTATPMGDPIEMEGLTSAFRRGTADTAFCRLGSVKSNIGHLVIAAGAAGVIKTALSLAHRKLPPSLHFRSGNPAIDFAGSPFVVNAGLGEWKEAATPLRAGVSSFGVGGTNAHVILEQAPERPESEAAAGPQLMVLSARTPGALARAALRLADALQASQEGDRLPLADVAWTLAKGRKAFAHRIALVAADASDAIAQLGGAELAAAAGRSKPARLCQPVFMFPGQGSHYAGMGRALMETEPRFRAAFDECHEVLQAVMDIDLHGLVSSPDPSVLLPTAAMQPAIFAVEYALARAWMDRGVVPKAMLGHSIGEFVAATLAGVFSLPDAVTLVARRGALMQAQPGGAMLSVKLPLDELLQRLPADLSLAAENAPGSCVVAGTQAGIARWRQSLEADGVACRELHTSHAFHSAMMEPVVAPFRELVAGLALHAPTIPIASGRSGEWLDAASATSPGYWARHLREPVRFAAALSRVLAEPGQVLLEVGTRNGLCSLARQHPMAHATQAVAIASLGDAVRHELAAFRLAAGQLWCQGVALDPAGFDRRGHRQLLRLPTYPFERQRFWVEAAAEATQTRAAVAAIVARAEAGDGQVPASEPGAGVPVATHAHQGTNAGISDRLVEMLKGVTGFEFGAEDRCRSFIELGLDSLMLTQVSIQLKKKFGALVSFRQLMGDYSSIDRLAPLLASQIAAVSAPATPVVPDATPPAEQQARAAAKPAGAATTLARPAIAGARLGRQPDGTPAWFVPHPEQPGKFLRIGS